MCVCVCVCVCVCDAVKRWHCTETKWPLNPFPIGDGRMPCWTHYIYLADAFVHSDSHFSPRTHFNTWAAAACIHTNDGLQHWSYTLKYQMLSRTIWTQSKNSHGENLDYFLKRLSPQNLKLQCTAVKRCFWCIPAAPHRANSTTYQQWAADFARVFGLRPEASQLNGEAPETELYCPVLVWNGDEEEGMLFEVNTALFYIVMLILRGLQQQ